MKKISLYLLVLILVFLSVPAFATVTNGQGETVARSGELAAFLDGSGNIYISGLNTPVNTTKAKNILSIDPYRILFFAQANAASGIPEGRLCELRFSTASAAFTENIITDDAFAACLDGDSIYYISRSNRMNLLRYDLTSGQTFTAHTAVEAMERIYVGFDGVILTLVEGAGAYVQDAITGKFIPYSGSTAVETAVFEAFEVFLSDNNSLYIQEKDALAPVMIDSSVQDWAVVAGNIYYITGNSDSLTLKSYNTSTAIWNTILTSTELELQLTASEKSLFMLSKAHTVYTVDIENGQLVHFASLASPQSYALTGSKSIDGYRIEAVSGQLNIYGIVEDSSTLPTFTFVDFTSEIVEDASSEIMLLSAYAIGSEDTVWDLLQPAPQYSTLRKGNRGEAVSAIQQPLYDLKYYDYRVDGIFGWRTELAIELLQADLGLTINGIADADLQRLILSGTLDPYDPYRALAEGSRGYRVKEMQQRLRDLGYLADDADGIFGPRTRAALQLFQAQHGLSQSGTADSDALRLLYSSNASSCISYIDLQQGDTGYRVRELNRRLKELYYLEGDVGSTYTKATAEAVRRFQEEIGLTQNGRATSAVQQRLFSKNVPEYSGYITLRRGDQNSRVKYMQRRLQELGYYSGSIDGYFGKETRTAVKSFQHMIGMEESGVADPNTLAELYRSNAPAYQPPVKISAPNIELSAYTKYENGIYSIADSATTDGGVTVSWYAEGDVAGYDISIVDDRNVVYVDNRNIQMTIASIPVTSLDAERTYTVTVTAHPEDSKNDKAISASIRFVRVMAEPEPEPEEIGTIGKLIVTPEGQDIERENNIYLIPGDMLTFKWSADGSVSGYAYIIVDSNGNTIDTSAEISTNHGIGLSANNFAEDETYTLSVYAVPTNGTIGDATVESIRFRRKIPAAATPEPTEEPAPLPTEEPTPVPTEEPTPEPTEEPAAPVSLGVPSISIEPMIGSAFMEVPAPDGSIEGADVIHLGEGTIEFHWAAEDAIGYNVLIVDANTNEMVNQNLTTTGATIPSTNLSYGMPYSITVTAYGSDGATTTARAYFVLPAPAAPIVDDPVEEPVDVPVEEPVDVPVEEPVDVPVEEPVDVPVEEPVDVPVEEPVDVPVEEPIVEPTEEPTPEPTEEPTPEPTEEPTPEPTEEPTPEPTEEPTPEPTEEPTPEPTEEPTPEPTEEPTPEPTEEPTPEPTEEPTPEPTEEPTPEPTEEPTPEPTEESAPPASYPMDDPGAWQSAIDSSSDPEAIHVIQKRLVEWKWLTEGSFEKGILDEATINAIIYFQDFCNGSGLAVAITDPADPVIEPDTLRLLFNADGVSIPNPNA